MKGLFMFSKILRTLTLLAAVPSITACAGPGRRGAFERQLSSQSTAPVLSVQGYVIHDAEDGHSSCSSEMPKGSGTRSGPSSRCPVAG